MPMPLIHFNLFVVIPIIILGALYSLKSYTSVYEDFCHNAATNVPMTFSKGYWGVHFHVVEAGQASTAAVRPATLFFFSKGYCPVAVVEAVQAIPPSPTAGEAVPKAPSPLDQFAILPLIPMKLGNLYFSFTNPSLFMLLTLSLVLLLLHFVTKKGGGNSVPNVWQSLVELIYDFVLNLVNEQIGGLSGNVKQKFFPCILVTFTFLLFRNLQGMIPYSFTVTSHFLITLGLSFSIFIGITIVGFQRNGLHFLSFSLPAGVPLPLAPFLVLLELIPHCFRALSLGIRLFANMMAGHSSVKILSGFAWTMLCMNDLFYFIGDLGPLFIVLALTGLELGVAILQAHVFTILICIYLNDATNLHQNGSLVKGGYSVAIAHDLVLLTTLVECLVGESVESASAVLTYSIPVLVD